MSIRRSARETILASHWVGLVYFGAAMCAVGWGALGCGSSATSTSADRDGDSTDLSGDTPAPETVDSEPNCSACLIVERTPELEEGEWIEEDRIAASVLEFENLQAPLEIPLTPPGHMVRSIVWGPDREFIVARHEGPPSGGQPGSHYITVFAVSADFAPTEVEPPADGGSFGITRIAGANDDWSSMLANVSEDGLTTYYAYNLDPESDGDRNLGAITQPTRQMIAYPMPAGHGVLFRSPLPGGTNFDCQWYHWDNELPAILQYLDDATCSDAAPQFSADGSVFAVRLEDEEDSQRERVVIYDSASIEPVMTLPSADQVRLSFGPEGSRFAYHVEYFSLVGDVAQADAAIYLGEAARDWLQNIAEWGRAPLGGAVRAPPHALRPLFFTDPATLMVWLDEPYLVSFDGGPWKGLGNPAEAFEPFVRSGRLGYLTDEGIYLVADDFVSERQRISHVFESEQAFSAPIRIPSGFAYQTYGWVDDVERAYRLRAVLDGQEPVAIEGIDERSTFFTILPLQAAALGRSDGTLLHARGGADLGQLYHLSEVLEPTVLATDVSTFR